MVSDPTSLGQPRLWGLVLAGGEGKRLEGYIREHYGESLPKQYMNFIGTRSMIEHTFARAERLIPRERILTIVTKHHLKYSQVQPQLSRRPRDTVIIQPTNKDTGVGLLLPLTYLYKRCSDAVVAVFPSDHFILEEARFIDHVRRAARAVQQNPAEIVLLGIEPTSEESDYGYIVPSKGNSQSPGFGCRRAIQFVEKPNREAARLLIASGALWNTMIMVFRVDTLLAQVAILYPEIARFFLRLSEVLGTSEEIPRIKEIYRSLPPFNFSKDILEKIGARGAAAISVLAVSKVTWSDWGAPQRLDAIKKSLGRAAVSKAQQTFRHRDSIPSPGPGLA